MITNMEKGKKHSMYVLIALFVFLLVMELYSSKEESDLRKEGVLTIGIVTKFSHSPKYGGSISYEFNVNGKTISNGRGLGYFSDAQYQALIGKTFPVIYDQDNTNENDMLIRSEDFKKYNVLYPDSLNWVIHLLGR